MKLKCIVIEDEPPAMELILGFIRQTSFLELSNFYFDALEGLSYALKEPVDIIFLDIEMPDLNGIEFTRQLVQTYGSLGPAIIFTTAYDHFALEGFKLDIVDYLLKPFEYEEFLRAANKANRFASIKSMTEEIKADGDDCIYLNVEYQIVKLYYSDIISIEGLKDYARFRLINPERNILTLVTLKALEEKLPAERFVRIHKSVIISLDKMTSFSKSTVTLADFQYSVSESYRDKFSRLTELWRGNQNKTKYF